MKKILIVTFLFVGIHQITYAQCSNPFYEFKEGTKIVVDGYNDKDKPTVKTISDFKNVEKNPEGYRATVHYEIYDKKEKLISEGDYDMTCKNGIIEIDMSAMLPSEALAPLKNYEMEIKMDELEMPDKLSVGQKLKDASIHISAKNSPIPMNVELNITNREVTGKESVTTPAGTFDCYKLTYDSHVKMMMINNNIKNEQYIADKVGTVKTVSYKDNGKMIGYTVLTTYEP